MGFTPSEQEAVFLTISRANCCTYCTGAHSMVAGKKSGVPVDVLETLREGETLPDVKLQALSCFVEAMVLSRGNPGQEAVEEVLAAVIWKTTYWVLPTGLIPRRC